ncbi:MAG: DUF2017 domain-containing protein [Actinobacteria bacterium]|nr:MAG: DUF2017 domain-containing protein [Actinomycetota bacterium]
MKVRIAREERQVLRGLPAQLRQLMDEDPDDPAVRRLFPPAYRQRPDHEQEYRRLMGDDLRERRLAALAAMEETVDADVLTAEQASGWLRALNDLRLVLGTRLDVQDDTFAHEIDEADPRAPALALYGYLSVLEEELVEALAEGV